MQVDGNSRSFAEADTQALAVAVFQNEKADEGFLQKLDSLTGGLVKSVIDSEELNGKENETCFLHLPSGKGLKAQRLLLVGVGEKTDYQLSSVSQMAGTAARFLRGRNVKSIAFVPRAESNAQDTASVVVEGAIIGLLNRINTEPLIKTRRQLNACLL